MASELRLECLGGMQITRNRMPLTGYVSVKVPALLCYLAVTGRPQFRLVLAGLLWSDLPEEDACANLRKALSNLRDLAGDHLIITPHTVAFDRQSAYWLDVEAFLAAANRGVRRQARSEHVGASGPPSSPTLSSESSALPDLLAAAELYRGDFLDGFYVRHASLSEEWVSGQREGLRRLAGRVLKQLAEHYAGSGEFDRAIECTARLLALDPWQEEAHRQMMVLLARNGERSAALAQYETCRRLLKRELNVEPSAETTALYRRIRAIGAPRPHNLPAAVTSFVGRTAELAQLADGLADPRRRLLSILGPAGVGKTRLALEAAAAAKERSNDAFLAGIFFVPLANVRTTAELIGAIAAATRIALPSGADPREELLHRLHDRDLLLILDGFEHLIAEAGFLTTLLQRAPQVKLLITSQQRLNLTAEWPLELAGLPCSPMGQLAGCETADAVQLFLQRAQQARPDFQPSALELQAITYICALTEGLPLAIELAAAAVRSMTCLEIAQAVEAGAEALMAFARDMPLRHRSLRAATEYACRLLMPHERQALRRLAIFQGGFTREAAEKVAGADLTVLTSLADKSLLRRSEANRYDFHAVLRPYAVEMLRQLPAEHEETRARHVRYYLGDFMAQREAELRNGRQEEAAARFWAELGNLQAAWRRAAAHGQTAEIGRSLLPMALLAELCGRQREGAAAFDAAIEDFKARCPQAETATPEERIVFGAMQAIHGIFSLRAGDLHMARARLQESHALLSDLPAVVKEMAYPRFGLGLLAGSEGRLVEAESYFREALALVRADDDPLLTAVVLKHLAETCAVQDRPDEAQQVRAEALTC